MKNIGNDLATAIPTVNWWCYNLAPSITVSVAFHDIIAIMNTNGGPRWANPEGTSLPTISTTAAIPTSHVTQHEAELFAPLSTLDEPIRETIMRDVRSVASKLKVVLLPMERSVCAVQ